MLDNTPSNKSFIASADINSWYYRVRLECIHNHNRGEARYEIKHGGNYDIFTKTH